MSHEANGVHRHTPTVALAVAGLLAVMALAGPVLLQIDPLAQTLSATSQPPSADWWLGTDALGRSVLARTVAGARISLGAALLASGLTAGLGTAVGLLAAELGGLAERALLALTDTVYACPALLLVLLVTELFDGGVWMVTAGLVVARWPAFTRLCHPLARAALQQPDAEASRLLGFGRWYRLGRHAWPAIRPSIVSVAALQFGNAMLSIAALGFLGVGLLPPQPEWGAMIAEAIPSLSDQPVMLAAPALGIFLATWAATLIGEAYAPGEPSA